MINANRSKQDWSIGQTVKVGFLALTIVDIAAVKDGLPDIYLLVRGKVHYRFVPHHGLMRLADDELLNNEWTRV